MSTEAEARNLVQEFFAAWTKGDADLAASFFTEDGVYHNIPMTRIEGREAIRETIAGWLSQMDGIDFRFENVLVQGNLVAMERYDLVPGKDGTPKELGAMGIMELRDGKIAAWREYFDLAQLVAISGDVGEPSP